jgi:hypothetical protein
VAPVEIPGHPIISLEYMQTITKSQAWQALQKRFKRVVDNIGKHIDSDILDTVIAFNVAGIHTTASCEGHLDHRAAYPWIDIGHADADSLEQEILQLLSAGKREHKETKQLQQKHRLLHLQEEQKLVALLEGFYQHHPFNYDRHLSIWRFPKGEARLQSHGAEYQQFRSAEEKALKLKEYQEEMQAFTDYLQQIHFQA